MLKKPLGNTNQHVSAIGLGTGVAGYSGARADYEALDSVVRAAIDLGMTLIDTAPAYGAGEAEVRVGRALRGAREKAFLATKVSPGDLSRDDVVASAERSLRRLGTDFVDLLQIHWSNPDIPIEDTAEGLSMLVEQGKVRHLGVSNFSLRELADVRRAVAPAAIVSNQLEYNLFDRSVEGQMLPALHNESTTLIAYSPLHRGKITLGRDRLNALEEIGSKYRKTAAQVALNWLVRNEAVVAIPNTTNVDRVKELSESVAFTLSPEELDDIGRRCSVQPTLVPTNEITVPRMGDGHVYTNLEEALENRHDLAPSPSQLADQIRSGEFLKPVRVIARPDGRYDLVEGRLRYWAWVIAHDGVEPISALIDES